MKSINWLFVGFAFLAAFSFVLIGIAIAERSILGILLAIIFSICAMGLGFTMKKKMREQGKL